MENLNAEQVKKALECCSSSDGVSACESGCPYWGGDYDTCPCIEEPNFIIKNALALINSQEQRIGELEKRLRYLLQSKTIAEYDEVDIHTKEYVKDIHSLDANIKGLTEENERLKAPKYFLHEDGRIEKLTNKVVIARMGGRNCGKIHELARAFEMAVRADTVRKMQAEIKNRCIQGGIYPAFVATTIDKIAKEMIDNG